MSDEATWENVRTKVGTYKITKIVFEKIPIDAEFWKDSVLWENIYQILDKHGYLVVMNDLLHREMVDGCKSLDKFGFEFVKVAQEFHSNGADVKYILKKKFKNYEKEKL